MLTIRVATAEDIPLLSQMGNTSYTHHFAHLWQNRDELQIFLEQEYGQPALRHSLADNECRWLIATTSLPVGFAKFSLHQPIEGEAFVGTLLNKLYLMPNETRRGYGEALFTHVCQQAKSLGETRLWLEVLADNPQARRFYERQGMQHIKDVHFATATQTSILQILGLTL